MKILPVALAIASMTSFGCFAATKNPDPHLDEQRAIVKESEKYDWVRLTSGEWLKGDIKAYYDKQLEFESDVLDTLYIDREDIFMVISGRSHAVRFNDGTVLEGPLNISGGYVVVGMSRPDQYKYSDLVSVAPSFDDALSAWSIKVGIGANISKGNTEQTEYSASVDIKRRTASNRLLINALADRTSNDDEITENNIRASGTFDWFYTKSLYFRPISFDYFRDPFQNIDHKYTIGAGIGYYLIDTDKTEWDIGMGPAFQHTEFSDVVEGTDKTNSSSSFYIESNTEYELTSDIDLTFDYKFTFAETAAGGNAQSAKAGASFDITDDIDFDISFVWDHLKSPVANADGTIPENDDYKMVVQLGIEL
ncbi:MULTISPECIES: DUF481 domain-containing protein [Pseudoalteromonas]|uniref:DUF481 domain-containing protein n=1 Tax=Pseudoalteromonas haloplanktis TaxID=228 RepID=A0ABU1B7T1_PSEHA|nr:MULTISPECIES: DUF481 domain-containing protein [Pseudoalteromonas]MCF6143087.1 hypothetical protein [Pseudoalteromonas mariniglutinosa NCIMB 1770]MDQ9090593.1 DUF481 domain-containing protein [Pseudoalteromonas haloplanktis]BDF94170.1 hypothetical protein KAN5_10080 [Pseudoalteromonas sp. KAN5]